MNWKINSDVNGDGTSPARRTTWTVPADGVEQRTKPGQVEIVVKAFAHGLEQDRKVGELRDLQQVFRT